MGTDKFKTGFLGESYRFFRTSEVFRCYLGLLKYLLSASLLDRYFSPPC